MPTDQPRRWFDAHLDLAYLAERGRDMHAPLNDCRGPLQPAAVTLPALRDANVRACLGTIFTEATKQGGPNDGPVGPYAYDLGNADAANRAGQRQLKLYQAWAAGDAITRMPRRGSHDAATTDTIQLGILMECADPILAPDDLTEWASAGVVAIGMAWWHESRYAGGNGSDNAGLTDLGRALIPVMDEHNVTHDLSHLSQRATDQLLERTDAPVIASHSNCRALLPGDNHRHLADDTIREIARRGGVIGINLVRNFLDPTLAASKDPIPGDATIDQVCDHIEHACEVAGDRRHVGLGSDMDGGITADDLPNGIDTPSDLHKITDALAARGWSSDDLDAFAFGNWARFWNITT
ncbi:MAG: membrane dipeptidase [Phycisphaerales bacterium]